MWGDGAAFMVGEMTEKPMSRRPLKSRDREWAKRLAALLARRGVAPNAISLLSVVAAALAGLALLATRNVDPVPRALLLIAAALFIQLRLLCNLLDGMVAVEGGRASKSGELFNDAPDRVADALILAGTGYALPWPGWGCALGWSAALVAVLTAYIRMLGGSVGLRQDFCGPMAKPHRMALLTCACLLSMFEGLLPAAHGWMLSIALAIIAIGGLLTAWRRLRRIHTALEAR